MDSQTLIVLAIVAMAVWHVGRKFLGRKSCGCGSDGGCCGGRIADKPLGDLGGNCNCDKKN